MDYGRQKKEKNFSWHTVILNLTSGKEYVPSEPWVSKVKKYGNVESDIFINVDYLRSLVWCNRECWNPTKCFDSKCNYLGTQDKPRKRKRPN